MQLTCFYERVKGNREKKVTLTSQIERFHVRFYGNDCGCCSQDHAFPEWDDWSR